MPHTGTHTSTHATHQYKEQKYDKEKEYDVHKRQKGQDQCILVE